jgi:hypothetical protein
MVMPEAPSGVMRTHRRSRGSSLLLLAGIPLVILHAGLLLERALHRETLDEVVIIRWGLAIALLAVLKRAAPRIHSLQSPTLGIAAILIFALIHAPVAAPEPSLPIAATGFGLALSLAVIEGLPGRLSVNPSTDLMVQPASAALSPLVSRETLKDRAPPVSR